MQAAEHRRLHHTIPTGILCLWPLSERQRRRVPEIQGLNAQSGRPRLWCVTHSCTINLRCRSWNGIRKSRHSRRKLPPNRSHTEFPIGPSAAFAALVHRDPSLLGPVPSRRCCPGRGSQIDTDAHRQCLAQLRSVQSAATKSHTTIPWRGCGRRLANAASDQESARVAYCASTCPQCVVRPGSRVLVSGRWQRSWPHEILSVAIRRIKFRRSLGRRGRPSGLDLQRQKIRNPRRCQRMSVSGLTLTSAFRH